MPCQWSSSDFYRECTDLRERFLLSGAFYLTLLPASFFQSLPRAGSLTLILAGFRVDIFKT